MAKGFGLTQPEVFKVQWPISGDQCLAYNKTRVITIQFPTEWLDVYPEVAEYMEENLKTYVMGHMEGTLFHIDSFLAEEDYPEW